MGYQAVKLTESTPENTLWYCRYCGGGMAVSTITAGGNHEDGEDKGDAKFKEEKEAEEGKATVRLKITE